MNIGTNRSPLSKPELYTYRDQEKGAQLLLEFLEESRLRRFPGTQPQGTLYHCLSTPGAGIFLGAKN